MTGNPLVSVVIPVYNGNNYLREAIDSVLNQTYNNYEIIVVDDGSTDNTWDIIQSYGDKVRGFHKENGGATSALNYGISVMKGEWFAWLSHDDLWYPTYIEKQIDNLRKHPECPISYTGFCDINYTGEIINNRYPQWYPRGKATRIMVVYGEYTNGITIIINKKCFDEVGVFDSKLSYVQDTDMWFRLLKKYNSCYLPVILAKRRVHPNQTGVSQKDAFYLELKNYLNIIAKNTPMSDYYPELEYNKISYFNNILVNTFCKIYYKKYVVFCRRYNLPITIPQLIIRITPQKIKYSLINLYSKLQNLSNRIF